LTSEGDGQRKPLAITPEKAAPLVEKLHEWMLAQRELLPEGSAIAKVSVWQTP
jgi:transposase